MFFQLPGNAATPSPAFDNVALYKYRVGGPAFATRNIDLAQDGTRYFDWHHTDADTLDKVRPVHFRKAVAMLAVMGFVLADMTGTLGG